MQRRLPIEEPAQIFLRAFMKLMPRTTVPEFKVRFRPYASLRSSICFENATRRISASLSDLLEEAPPDVVGALAMVLLAKLYGRRIPPAANANYNRWVNLPETQQRMLGNKRKRGHKRMLPPRGRVYSLDALFDRLNAEYFGAALPKPTLGWSLRASTTRLGHYDVAHDAIVISRVFDRPHVPSLALEYVLYHEMLHIKHPVQVRSGGRRCAHTPEFQAEERRFPSIDEAKRLLLRL
ncbi:MAG: M48 family peptidase [Bryobacterales bacterium]|nr:M48 family peptidase [Bryobacterales bacterium]